MGVVYGDRSDLFIWRHFAPFIEGAPFLCQQYQLRVEQLEMKFIITYIDSKLAHVAEVQVGPQLMNYIILFVDNFQDVI